MRQPDGVIDAGGRTQKKLGISTAPISRGLSPAANPAQLVVAPTVATTAALPSDLLSGSHWHGYFRESVRVDDLSDTFRPHVEAFMTALNNAHANVQINTTTRPRERALLMNRSWAIAHGTLDPRNANCTNIMVGGQSTSVPIDWVHYDAQGNYSASLSRSRAQAMVNSYQMAFFAALDSTTLEAMRLI